ncbi:hypothetical protein [Flavisolibacter ginsenosidimutans]|uniref:Uncharacterized protein n=1 Tax=Flavisolibacter ginsenosidimutans TaxID=661481 RepID=A0A5B8UN93_9BACT|nr:hypothetical protein [Flavisolibacter ginsenosidimutans]QEC57689.1 hypothetical protein FSB75_17860 [Flavisolibacter ginsenosidimutans]
MKKVLIPFASLFVCAIALVSWKNASTRDNGAFIANDFTCGLIDGDGNFAFADASHTVITSSGNSVLKCSATVPNSTGKAVNYNDFLCGTFIGLTTDSHETVSASGQATLTCKVH